MNNISIRYTLLVCFLGVTLLVASCGGSSTNPEDPEFDRVALLTNMAGNIIGPSYAILDQRVAEFETSVNAFSNDPNEANLLTVQASLRQVRLAWQDANLFQFGPAESNALRSTLNTFPTDTSKINSNISSGNYVLGTIANINAGGLPALDYLLHGTGDTNAQILEQFTSDADAAARITYLNDNVDLIKTAVTNTTNSWSAEAGSYRTTFLSPDNAGVDVGSSLGQLVNALVQHYERFIRDGKIGIPVGVRSAGVARPTTTEAFYAGNSRELAIANLQAVQRLFLGTGLNGTEGVGLAENLEFLEATELSSNIESELNEAIAAIQALSDPLSQNISGDSDAVLAAFTEMQEVIVLLKADLTSTLGISITFQDNDGD